jgi:hypothetical protein
MPDTPGTPRATEGGLLFTLLGLNRAGKYLYLALFVLAIPALGFWTTTLPRLRFHEPDERLFYAARHGDVAGIERALGDGANVNAASPLDGRTALSRAALLGQPDGVRALLKAGANPDSRGGDDRTALQLAEDARKEESSPDRARALDGVIAALREVQR